MHDYWSVIPTPEQGRVLAAIDAFVAAHGAGPTLAELGAAVGLSSPSAVRYHILRLGGEGLITFLRTGREGRLVARTLRLSAAGARALELYTRLQSSSLVRGEYDLLLDAASLAAARAVELPFHALSASTEGDCTVIHFRERAERDYWAARLLDAQT